MLRIVFELFLFYMRTLDQSHAIKTGYWLKNGCLIVDNHKLPIFSVAGAFFYLGTFLVVTYLYVFQVNHNKPGVSQMGVTKVYF